MCSVSGRGPRHGGVWVWVTWEALDRGMIGRSRIGDAAVPLLCMTMSRRSMTPQPQRMSPLDLAGIGRLAFTLSAYQEAASAHVNA